MARSEVKTNARLFRPLLKGWPLIILFVGIAVTLASRYLRYATPLYESTAKIKLADANDGPASTNLYKDLDVFVNKNKVEAELEMLKSKVLVSKALDSVDFDKTIYRIGKVRKTELYKEAPFKVIVRVKDSKWYEVPLPITVSAADRVSLSLPGEKVITSGFGKVLSVKGLDIVLVKNGQLLQKKLDFKLIDRYEVIVKTRGEAADDVIKNLDVTSVDKEVPVLRISYKSAVPQKAADLVNELSKAYIEDYVNARYNAANTTVEFLDKQLTVVGSRLHSSENAIESYRNENGIVNLQQETETDLRKVSQLKVQLANLEMNLAAIDTVNNYIQQGKGKFLDLAPNFEAFTDLLSTEMVKKIKQLQSDKKDLLTKYTPANEKVTIIDDKINDLTSYLQESISNTRKNYEIKYNEINNAIKDAEKSFVNVPAKEKSMTILERNFGLNEKIYNFLHQKRTEAEIARAATVSFHRIIATGEVPQKPVSPNRVLIIAVAVILALLSSIGLIYSIETVQAKVYDTDMVEKSSETPVIAQVPLLQTGDIKAYFSNLAIQLELRRLIHYPSVVAYTSFNEGEGKSFNAANMAKGLLSLGKKVLLVDVEGKIATHENPHIHPFRNDITGIAAAQVNYYKANEETEEGVVIKSEIEQKISGWKQQFDVIIIANEPLSKSSNSLVYMAVADLNLFILDAQYTSAKKILEADLVKEEYNIANMKFMLNRIGGSVNVLHSLKETIIRVNNRFTKKKTSDSRPYYI